MALSYRLSYTLFVLVLVTVSLPSQATTALPFTSDFETGDFSEWQGGLDATLTVSNLDAASGNFAARAVMTQGIPTDNYKDYYFGDHQAVGGTPPSNGLWLRFYSKFETGFHFGTANLQKLAIINFTDSNGLRRFQIIINIDLRNNQYMVENLKWNADRSFAEAWGWTQNIGTPAAIRFGEWDKIKLYIRPNTSGLADGIVRLWINDTLKIEATDAPIRQDSNFNPNKFILSNYVTATDTYGIQWWDNFYLGDTDPDNTTNDPPPSAPILLQIQ